MKQIAAAIGANPPTQNPYFRAESLDDLLRWDDADFVRCAYVTLLGRQPDYSGEQHFLAKIRKGHAKEEILLLLRRSGEGQRHDPGILGLDRALGRAALARRPLVGRIVRFFLPGLDGDSAMDRRLRAIMNALGRNDVGSNLQNAIVQVAERTPTAANPATADQELPTPDTPELQRLKIDAPLQSYFRDIAT